MESILTLNQSIFSTKSRERRISKIALKASVKELYVPQESEEITYDDGYDIDGGALSFSRGWLATTIDLSIAAICCIPGVGQGLAALLGVKNLGRFFGRSLANSIFKKMGNSIVRTILTFACSALASYIGNAGINVLCDNICANLFSCLSIGGLIGMAVDAIDGNFDGMITFGA